MTYWFTPKKLSWKGSARSTKNITARLSARFAVDFGTAYRRTMDSEHCSYRLNVPGIWMPAMRGVPGVICSLGCLQRVGRPRFRVDLSMVEERGKRVSCDPLWIEWWRRLDKRALACRNLNSAAIPRGGCGAPASARGRRGQALV